MKTVSLLFLFTMSSISHAVVFWPGDSAPCDGTLQACVDGSAANETIEIITNDTINESIVTTVPVSLIAGNGFKPQFGPDHGLTLAYNSGFGGTVRINGLTFQKGFIDYIHSLSAVTLYIENNDFMDDVEEKSPIMVTSYATADLELHINFNRIHSEITTDDIIFTVANISVRKESSSGNINGNIYGNTIYTSGMLSRGIVISNSGDAPEYDLNVVGNEIYGGSRQGIYIVNTAENAINEVDVVSNALFRYGVEDGQNGIVVENDRGTTHVDIINNTVHNRNIGVLVAQLGLTTVTTANIYNNIVVDSFSDGFSFSNGVTVDNDYNLTFNNFSNNNYTPGANALVDVDPLFESTISTRLSASSPAMDAGNPLALLFVADAPEVDADGLLRVKKSSSSGTSTVDLGAFEAGDFIFTHTSNADNTGGHSTRVDSIHSNGLSSLDNLHITAHRGWDFSLPANNDNEGIWYSMDFWRIFNEAFLNLTSGTTFNVMSFGSNANTFEHSVDVSGFNISGISHPNLNGNPDMILQLTQHWTGWYNPHPPGVLNDGVNWYIRNLDSVNLPNGSNFNVYFQEPSKSAFEHIAADENTISNTTDLDHPLLNGTPCALIQVTQSASQGVYNDSPVGVNYDSASQRWQIVNQDDSNLPFGAAFHVLIHPGQIVECSDLIYRHSFD